MKNTGTGIRDVLSQKGMTQEQLADKMGIGLGVMEKTLNELPPPNKLEEDEKKFVKEVCKVMGIDKTLLLFKCLEKDDIPNKKKEIFDELAPSIMGLIDNLLKDEEVKEKRKHD